MKRAILTHRRDFIAVSALVVGAIAVVVYVLTHQPAFTFLKNYYTVHAQFSTGAAVTAGQGQTVDIAGVEIGQVGGVKLQDGHAVVTMNIFKKYAPIYRNATVLLRPRTPLKDMYLALNPGTKDAGAIPNGGNLPVGATNPDVNFQDILSALDADTRNYLQLLLAGGAQAFHDQGDPGEAPSPAAVNDLRGTFKRFAPLSRDTRKFASLLATRRQNLSRAIHNLNQVANSLGSVDTQLTSLINSSNTNFQAISSQDANLEAALSLLPGTIQQTTQTMGKVQGFANESGIALHQLVPFAHALGPALQAAQPLFRDTTPVIRDQLRPFAVAVQPVAKILEPAAAKLSQATPNLTKSFAELNTLFNMLAYQPRGGPQGYLFWGSWLSHIADSITNVQDSHGAMVRGVFLGACSDLNFYEGTTSIPGLASNSPSLGPLLFLVNAPDWSKLPGANATAGTCPTG